MRRLASSSCRLPRSGARTSASGGEDTGHGTLPLSIGVCIPREIRFFFDQVRDGILQEAAHFESVGINTDTPTPGA